MTTRCPNCRRWTYHYTIRDARPGYVLVKCVGCRYRHYVLRENENARH